MPRHSLALVLPFLFAFSLPAAAENTTIDATTITCAELVAAETSETIDDYFGAQVILAWMAGYHATTEQGTVVDLDALNTDVNRTMAYCKKFPRVGVYSASEKFMGENATEASSEAVDLATIKCQRIVEAAKNNEAEKLGVLLMWLAGYYASYAQDKIIDKEKLRTSSYELGKACAQSQEIGLITVADKFMQHESE